MTRKLTPFALCLALVLCSAAYAAPAAAPAPAPQPTRVKSWIYIDASAGSRVLVEGERWEVPVEYYLDPSEDDGGTKLTLVGLGPWIDTPDGKYETERHHVSYPGLGGDLKLAAGKGQHTFTFTVPPALQHNQILLIAFLTNAAGQ